MAFSKIFEEVENNRREILNQSNLALDVLNALKKDGL